MQYYFLGSGQHVVLPEVVLILTLQKDASNTLLLSFVDSCLPTPFHADKIVENLAKKFSKKIAIIFGVIRAFSAG